MVRNLILSAVRNLRKSKLFSALNILGLAIGMAVFLLIAQYVTFEESFENFIPNASRIYRVVLTSYANDELLFTSAENYPGVGPALKNDLPEVLSCARLYNLGYKNNVIITYEDGKPDPVAFKQRRFLYADSAFLPMMGYPMIQGDSRTALAEPFSAVISETSARLYFGNEDALGKMLRMQDDDKNNELVKITGVFRDLPSNTHLKFDVLFSYKTLFTRYDKALQRYDHSWQRKDMYTFVLLQEGADPKVLESKFPGIVAKYNPSLKDKHQKDVLTLQPLRSIHLNSSLTEEADSNGDGRIVAFLGLIGLFVMVIAWVNYVNLSTAKALERAREVGIRKVLGAFPTQLVRQFLAESAIVNLLALLISLCIVSIALPFFNSLSGLSLTVNHFAEPWFLFLILALWAGGTLMSGVYPAFVLSSFKPVTVLKGKLKNSSGGIFLRKSLVVFQFMASAALIAGTLIVYRQLNYMMDRDLGMNISQVLVLDRPGLRPKNDSAMNSSIDVFRHELRKNPNVEAISTSVTIPGKQREYKAEIKNYGAPDDKLVTARINSMDYDFLDVFKMKLVAGRPFSAQFTHDLDTSVIITQSAASLLGYLKPEEAIGHTLAIPDFDWNPIIVGVVNDYHQVSLKKAMDPTVFFCSIYQGEFYSIRIAAGHIAETVDHTRQSWEKAFPGNPFDYFFLDDYFNKQYENEHKFGKLFFTFASLAVFVGCLGLFGLSAYTATQRTKEIGIRKIMGSSELKLFMLLSKEYLQLVTLSVLLASPIVWYVMNRWIENFPYRASISANVFLIAGAAVLFISLLTVSFQTWQAARANPVDTLRYE